MHAETWGPGEAAEEIARAEQGLMHRLDCYGRRLHVATRPGNCPFRQNTEVCDIQPALCLHQTFMGLLIIVVNYLFLLCHRGHAITVVFDTCTFHAGLLPVAFPKKIKCQASG